MIKRLTFVCILSTTLGAAVHAAAEDVKSLRGHAGISDELAAPETKQYAKDGVPIARDYVQQPPLIPHQIDDYIINTKSNKCLSCHSWKNYRESGATKISQTHFENREHSVLANVSARRYFCTQCHVPQVNAPPLVGNSFKPVTAISGE